MGSKCSHRCPSTREAKGEQTHRRGGTVTGEAERLAGAALKTGGALAAATGAGRGRGHPPRNLQREHGPADTSISAQRQVQEPRSVRESISVALGYQVSRNLFNSHRKQRHPLLFSSFPHPYRNAAKKCIWR